MPIRRGKAFYAKVLGAPVKNYDGDGYEWTIDISVDRDTMIEMEKEGVKAKPKDREFAENVYKFSKPSSFTDKESGEVSKLPPITVVDRVGQPWPDDKLIGNGSVVNVRYSLVEYEWKGKKGLKRRITGIQVLDHVPYQSKQEEFPSYDKNEDDKWVE